MAEARRQRPVIVAKPSNVDVRMGRGNAVSNTPGNERFRSVIEENKGR